jgi:hypothetical protein
MWQVLPDAVEGCANELSRVSRRLTADGPERHPLVSAPRLKHGLTSASCLVE